MPCNRCEPVFVGNMLCCLRIPPCPCINVYLHSSKKRKMKNYLISFLYWTDAVYVSGLNVCMDRMSTNKIIVLFYCFFF